MKVIMAQYQEHAEVIGQIKNTDDQVVFINSWLAGISLNPGHPRPVKIKVYSFGRHQRIPWALGTMIYVPRASEHHWAGQVG